MSDATEECGRCRFWRMSDVGGQCRRNPPSPSIPDGWSVTFPSDWCGEFRPAALDEGKALPGGNWQREEASE